MSDSRPPRPSIQVGDSGGKKRKHTLMPLSPRSGSGGGSSGGGALSPTRYVAPGTNAEARKRWRVAIRRVIDQNRLNRRFGCVLRAWHTATATTMWS